MAQLLLTQDEIDHDRERWLRVRRTGITASEIAAILGIAPKTHGSPFALFTAKTTGDDFHSDVAATRRGIHLEPVVADMFADQHPYLQLMPGGLYASDVRPWQLATFDRLAVDLDRHGHERPLWGTDLGQKVAERHGEPVQIKTSATREGWGEPYTDVIPVQYRAQALWEMDVQNADRIWVPCLFMQQWECFTYILERNDQAQADIEYMRAEAELFLDRLARNDPPEVDWKPATTKALARLYSGALEADIPITRKLARRYLSAHAAKERAEQRLGKAANEIRQAIGNGRAAVVEEDGVIRTVASRRRSSPKRIDVKRLRRERPDIAREFEVESPVDALYPGIWKG